MAASPKLVEGTPRKLIIDTDGGVDDAWAITWLLTQQHYAVEIVGITTVAGTTTVQQATQNILTVLDYCDRTDIPVVIGAPAPLVYSRSEVGRLKHGADGLWGLSTMTEQDLASLARDVPAFYESVLASMPDITILALGPWTNLAQAIERFEPEVWERASIIALAGAKTGGSQSPVASFNIWFDPQAAEKVIKANLALALVSLDSYQHFSLSADDRERLAAHGVFAARQLTAPMMRYAEMQALLSENSNTLVPDLVAAAYALDRSLGQAVPAVVRVVTEPGLTRGQTIVALSFAEQLLLLTNDAELAYYADEAAENDRYNLGAVFRAVLQREPARVQFVTTVDVMRLRELVLATLVQA